MLFSGNTIKNESIKTFKFYLLTKQSKHTLDVISKILKVRYGFDEIIYLSYQELVNEGYIQEVDPYFDSGLLISIEENDVKEESFIFNAIKYKLIIIMYFFSLIRISFYHFFIYVIKNTKLFY